LIRKTLNPPLHFGYQKNVRFFG